MQGKDLGESMKDSATSLTAVANGFSLINRANRPTQRASHRRFASGTMAISR